MFVTTHSRTIASSTCITLSFILALAYPYTSKARLQSDNDEPIACALSAAEIVILTASVSDENGEPVTELTHPNFEVFDNNVRQSIGFFSTEDEPVSVAIVFDLSKSVAKSTPTWFSAVCQGILQFKQRSNESSEYTIIGADRNPILVTDWTTNIDIMIDGLSRLAFAPSKSRTGIYDACQFALKKVTDRKNFKSAVLLITDGQDGVSNINSYELSDLSNRSNGLIYVVSPLISRRPGGTKEQQILARLALASGANSFFPSSQQVETVFGAIAYNLRTRYWIGYYPSDHKRDGSWHSVRVTASSSINGETSSELHVRTRSGYYAPVH